MPQADRYRAVPLPSGTQFMYVLGLLVDGSSALVGLKDLAGHHVFANRELESIFRAPPGGLVGRANGDVMEAADAGAHDARDRAVAATGQPAHSIDEYAIDGRRLAYATVRFPYRDEDKRIMGTGFVAIDVSDRVRTDPGEPAAVDSARHTIAALRRAVDDMQRQATTDRLTAAATRLRIEEAAHHEPLRLARYGHPLSLIFVDLDRFKRVNDACGHAAGDAVLREFCAVARRGMRATDILGRWGGDEFVILLPNTGVTSARVCAERIRAGLVTREFAHAGRVTASFGVAELQPDETFASWTARADAAMYRAKGAGGDRIVADVPANPNAIGTDNVDAGFLRRKPVVGDLTEFVANAVVARHMLVEDRKFFPYLQARRER